MFSDIPGHIFEKIVEFCYTGKVKTIGKDVVIDLFKAAKGLALEDLQKVCVDHFKQILDENTCKRIWTIGVVNKEHELRSMAADFLLANNNFMSKFSALGFPVEQLTLVLKVLPEELIGSMVAEDNDN